MQPGVHITDELAQAITLLLMRLQRDVVALGDYRTPQEQRDLLDSITYCVRNDLLFRDGFTHESAARVAMAYAVALKARLDDPAYFQKPSIPAELNRKPEGATTFLRSR